MENNHENLRLSRRTCPVKDTPGQTPESFPASALLEPSEQHVPHQLESYIVGATLKLMVLRARTQSIATMISHAQGYIRAC